MGTIIYLRKEYEVEAEPQNVAKRAVQRAYDAVCMINDIFVPDDPFELEKENLIQQAFFYYSLDMLEDDVKEGSKQNASIDTYITDSLQESARLKARLYNEGALTFLTEEEAHLFADIEQIVDELLLTEGE